jgi:hypothetical protein
MNMTNASIALNQNLPPPDYVTNQMGQAITLANMLDERKATIGQRQRQQNIRDIFKQPGMYDAGSGFSPDAIGQVAGQDIDEATKLGNMNAMMAYKQAMADQAARHGNFYDVQADTLPGYRAAQEEKARSATAATQQKMLQEKQKNALNMQASLLYNNGHDFDQNSYENAKAIYSDHIGTPEQHAQDPEHFWGTQEDFNKTFGGQFDPKNTPTAMNNAYEAFKGAVMPVKDQYGLRIKEKTADANAKLTEAKTGVVQQDSDSRKLAAEAAMLRAKKYQPGGGSGGTSYLSPEETAALNRAMFEGGLDPKWVNSRTGKLFAQQELYNPGKAWNSASAAATYERSLASMNTKALLSTINPLLDQLVESGKNLNNSNIKLVNKVVNFAREQTGDPLIVDFNNRRDDIIAEVERGLLGTGVLSDNKYLRAVRNVSSAQSPAQLDAAVDAMKSVISARLHAVRSGPNYGGTEGEVIKQPGENKGKRGLIPPKVGNTEKPEQPTEKPQVSEAETWARSHLADDSIDKKSGKKNSELATMIMTKLGLK